MHSNIQKGQRYMYIEHASVTHKQQWIKSFTLTTHVHCSHFCSMANGISFDVSLRLNCTDLYKHGGDA